MLFEKGIEKVQKQPQFFFLFWNIIYRFDPQHSKNGLIIALSFLVLKLQPFLKKCAKFGSNFKMIFSHFFIKCFIFFSKKNNSPGINFISFLNFKKYSIRYSKIKWPAYKPVPVLRPFLNYGIHIFCHFFVPLGIFDIVLYDQTDVMVVTPVKGITR